MKLTESSAEIWVPDGVSEDAALKRTTYMAIAAHQDDVEIMALEGILAGFGNSEKWFTAVIVTNGAGSPRDESTENIRTSKCRLSASWNKRKLPLLGNTPQSRY